MKIQKKVETTDFIVDLNSKDNIPITTPRGWNGTLYDQKSIEEAIKKAYVPYKTFTAEQREFIKKFTVAMHVAAAKKSIKKFNDFLEVKTFQTFNDLINAINLHNKTSSANSYIDVPLELIRNHAKYPIEFEKTLLKLYNTLCYFLVKTMVTKF